MNFKILLKIFASAANVVLVLRIVLMNTPY